MQGVDLFAYIDPVSGAIVLQLIIAGVLGCVAFFQKSIRKAISLVIRRKPDESR